MEALLRKYWVSRLPLCLKMLCFGLGSKCVVVQSLSCVQLCELRGCSTPSSSVLQYLQGVCSNSCPLSQ